MIKKTLLYCIIFINTTISAYGTGAIRFRQISINEGLSQSTINDAVQDNLGCLWLATQDGLNRYDGCKFRIYKNILNDSSSILSNIVYALFKDSKGYIWAGMPGGISKYDNEADKFKNYICYENGVYLRVLKIIEWASDQYYIGTNKGLFSFSESKGFKLIDKTKKLSINTLLKVNEELLLGTERGLIKYSPSSNKIGCVNEFFVEKNILCLLKSKTGKNQFWVGIEGAGLVLYDIEANTSKVYQKGNDSKSISSNYVRSLCYDQFDRLWVGTFVGLNILDKECEKFRAFYKNYTADGALSHNSIRSIMCDSQGGMWCGTYYGGMSYYHPLKSQFEHIHHIQGVNSLNDNVVSCIVESPEGKIWIGTNDHGLNLYDPASGKFSYFFLESKDAQYQIGSNVKATLILKNGNLLVGTHGDGLIHLDPKSKKIKKIKISDNKITNSNVYSLLRTEDGLIWIGTLNGIIIYDTNKNSFIPLGKLTPEARALNIQIRCLHQDFKGRIWIGSEKGIAIFKPENKKLEFVHFTNHSPIYINAIFCIFEDNKHRILLGSNWGLHVFDEKNNIISILSPELNTFLNTSVYGILQDGESNYWLSTNNGLICYNDRSNSWREYTKSDGIQSNQFNHYSACKTKDGKMYFGGINGITSFSPHHLVDNPFTPKVILSGLMVFNKLVLPNDNTGILNKNINVTKSLKLKAKYNQFGFEFTCPNYLAGNKITYAYKLEGYDQEWYITNNSFVSYSNLNPGKYIFSVKASNNNGKWSEYITQLEVIILPNWWETWWFLTIIFITIVYIARKVSLFYIGRRLLIKKLELEKKQSAFERAEKDKEKELADMRIRFFINVSHEFRTPLTLILSPLQEVLQRGISDKWIKEQLDFALRNALSMLRLVNQVLDYRKVNQGSMELMVNRSEITNFVEGIFELFKKEAEKKRIKYIYESSLSDKMLWYDPNFLERIITNLLGNAFKYTPDGGIISLRIFEDNDYFVVEVRDNGDGISKEKQNLVFNEFYQISEHSKGSGIGLSLVKRLVEIHHGVINLESELQIGTTVTIKLPIDEETYLENEKKPVILNTPVKKEHNSEYQDSYQFNPEDADIADISEPKTIMLVEDNSEIRDYLISNFSKFFNIIPFINGKQAWDYLERGAIVDLIISDVMMPEMDGIKLCRLIKSNYTTCHIPLILLTAKSDVKDQLAGLNVGADDYISKPFVFSILSAKVVNLFKTRQHILQKYSSSLEVEPKKIAFNAMDEEILKKAVSVVESNMDNCHFTTEEFCREMNMCRSKLHMKLKALTGESAIDFIRRIRFAYACKLLKDGRYSGAEISLMVGFNSPSHFSATFKKYVGCLPTEYIKKTK